MQAPVDEKIQVEHLKAAAYICVVPAWTAGIQKPGTANAYYIPESWISAQSCLEQMRIDPMDSGQESPERLGRARRESLPKRHAEQLQ